jgi:hypothetical protein
MKNLNKYSTCRTDGVLTNQFKGIWRYAIVILVLFLFINNVAFAQKAAASLEQIRNGSATSPTEPAQWQNGNAGNQTAHYVEGHSIGYRVLLTDLPANRTVKLTMAYDIRHSGKNAIDFLTHYDRLEPHGQFPHSTKETVDPTLGTSFSGAATSTFLIPRPLVNLLSPVVPGIVWDNLPNTEKVMSYWGGTGSGITNIVYDLLAMPSLDTDKAEQRIIVTFYTGTGGSAVLAWGGHIASRLDWGSDAAGVPLSAGGISGSPYHMRLKTWDLGNLGNQDRSLSASAVIPPPICGITPTASVCEGVTTLHTAAAEAGAIYTWTISGQGQLVNASGTQLTSPYSTGTTNQINVKAIGVGTFTPGSYTLGVTVLSTTGLSSTCSIIVPVTNPPGPSVSITEPSLCGPAYAKVTVTSTVVAGSTYTMVSGGVTKTIGPTTDGQTVEFTGSSTDGAFLTAGSGYSITVTAASGCISSPTTCPTPAVAPVSIGSQSSVQPIEISSEIESKMLTAYPVPFYNNATVEFLSERDGKYTVNLYDMKGNLIRELKSGSAKKGEMNEINFNGSNLPDGMYFVRFVTTEGAKTIRLLKSK